MAKRIWVLLADGFEEVEAVTPIDYLRRADAEVTTISVGKSATVTGSHKVEVKADALLVDFKGKHETPEALVLPGGGGGAKNLAASEDLAGLIKEVAAAGKIVAAICASPAVVLPGTGVLNGRRFTCYPGMEREALTAVPDAKWSADPVVTDTAPGAYTLITSRGAGTADLFSFAIIAELFGRPAADKLAASVVAR